MAKFPSIRGRPAESGRLKVRASTRAGGRLGTHTCMGDKFELGLMILIICPTWLCDFLFFRFGDELGAREVFIIINCGPMACIVFLCFMWGQEQSELVKKVGYFSQFNACWPRADQSKGPDPD